MKTKGGQGKGGGKGMRVGDSVGGKRRPRQQGVTVKRAMGVSS